MELRDATRADVPGIVRLHLEAFDASELSVALGALFVRRFYEQAVEDPDVSLRLVHTEDGPVAFSVAFLRYSVFEHRYRRAVRLPLIAFLLGAPFRGHLPRAVQAVRTALGDRKRRHVPSALYDRHLGNIAIGAAGRGAPALIGAFWKIFRDNVELLRAPGSPGFWTAARVSNDASIKWIRRVAAPQEEMVIDGHPEAIRLFYTRL